MTRITVKRQSDTLFHPKAPDKRRHELLSHRQSRLAFFFGTVLALLATFITTSAAAFLVLVRSVFSAHSRVELAIGYVYFTAFCTALALVAGEITQSSSLCWSRCKPANISLICSSLLHNHSILPVQTTQTNSLSPARNQTSSLSRMPRLPTPYSAPKLS